MILKNMLWLVETRKILLWKRLILGEKIDEQRVTNLTRRKKVQHFYYEYLTAAAVKRCEDSITSNGSRHDKARTFSNDGSLSGAWLHCVPKKGELKMDNTSFRTALMLRLGVPFNDRPRNFMPLAFEIYGSVSVSVNKLIQDLTSTAAERTYTPYHVLLFYGGRGFPSLFSITMHGLLIKRICS